MKLVKETKSPGLIKYVFSQDNLYDQIVDDGYYSFEQYQPYIGDGMHWFLLFNGIEIAGFIRLERMNEIMFMCHIAILQKHRGRGSDEWGKLVMEEAKKRGIKKLIALTSVPLAVRYAKKIGFKEAAILKDSFRQNGVLKDQTLLEVDL
jgi:GNAT superfamily N-acetyltransferase